MLHDTKSHRTVEWDFEFDFVPALEQYHRRRGDEVRLPLRGGRGDLLEGNVRKERLRRFKGAQPRAEARGDGVVGLR